MSAITPPHCSPSTPFPRRCWHRAFRSVSFGMLSPIRERYANTYSSCAFSTESNPLKNGSRSNRFHHRSRNMRGILKHCGRSTRHDDERRHKPFSTTRGNACCVRFRIGSQTTKHLTPHEIEWHIHTCLLGRIFHAMASEYPTSTTSITRHSHGSLAPP